MVLPVVWQPHIYLIRNHMRVYLEAAATFFYNISSTYENEYAREQGLGNWRGNYSFSLARDNRFSYGLAGGGGIAFLIKRFELNFRVRTTSAIRTSCETATATTTTRPMVRKTPSGPHLCDRR